MTDRGSERRILLCDTASLYFRAYHALPTSLTDVTGRPVNAVHGLLDMLARLIATYRPDQVVCAWDVDWRPTWRVALVPGYKAQRVSDRVTTDAVGAGGVGATSRQQESAPADLSAQLPLITSALGMVGFPIIGLADYEADDVLGTLTRLVTEQGGSSVVVTGDRDLFQLVDTRTRVAYLARGVRNHELVDDPWLLNRYGIAGGQYADFATLRGDASDGLPGVPGIGEKTAAKLIARFGDLDAVRAAASGDAPAPATNGMTVPNGVSVPNGVPDQPMAPALRSRLLANQDYLQRARQVVRVVRDLPLELPDTLMGQADPEACALFADDHRVRGPMMRLLAAMGQRLQGGA